MWKLYNLKENVYSDFLFMRQMITAASWLVAVFHISNHRLMFETRKKKKNLLMLIFSPEKLSSTAFIGH